MYLIRTWSQFPPGEKQYPITCCPGDPVLTVTVETVGVIGICPVVEVCGMKCVEVTNPNAKPINRTIPCVVILFMFWSSLGTTNLAPIRFPRSGFRKFLADWNFSEGLM